jgi:hypothetical protein
VAVSDQSPAIVRLGLLCARALYITEREDLARLADLEALVALREQELQRSEVSFDREQRRLDREYHHLELQRSALDGYHTILSYPSHHDAEQEESEEDGDEEEEDTDDNEDRIGLALAAHEVLKADSPQVPRPRQLGAERLTTTGSSKETFSEPDESGEDDSDDDDDGEEESLVHAAGATELLNRLREEDDLG